MDIVGERELLYLCSAVIQSLAALVGITLVAYGFISEKGRRLIRELYTLADTWWMRDNMTLADQAAGIKPDVSRKTTIEGAPTFLRRNLDSIRKSHPGIANEVEEKLRELETFKKLEPALFRKSLLVGFLGLLISTIILILASELGNSIIGFIFACLIICKI